MKNAILINLIWVFALPVCAQDSIKLTSGEIFSGRVKSFDNKRFTVMLSDKTEIKFPKDSVWQIVFDTDGIYENGGALHQEEEMDRDCAAKQIGNIKIINATGKKLIIDFEYKESHEGFTYSISESADGITYNGLKVGNYLWAARDNSGFSTSGGFYVPPCKTAKTIVIK